MHRLAGWEHEEHAEQVEEDQQAARDAEPRRGLEHAVQHDELHLALAAPPLEGVGALVQGGEHEHEEEVQRREEGALRVWAPEVRRG